MKFTKALGLLLMFAGAMAAAAVAFSEGREFLGSLLVALFGAALYTDQL